MKHLAKVTIKALMYFELCDDDELDPDVALKMSESILADLEESSSEEKKVLFEVVKELLDSEKPGLNREDVVGFLEGFNESYLPNY